MKSKGLLAWFFHGSTDIKVENEVNHFLGKHRDIEIEQIQMSCSGEGICVGIFYRRPTDDSSVQ